MVDFLILGRFGVSEGFPPTAAQPSWGSNLLRSGVGPRKFPNTPQINNFQWGGGAPGGAVARPAARWPARWPGGPPGGAVARPVARWPARWPGGPAVARTPESMNQ